MLSEYKLIFRAFSSFDVLKIPDRPTSIITGIKIAFDSGKSVMLPK